MPQSYQEYSSGLTATTYSVTFKYLTIDDVHALGFDGNTWTSLALHASTPRDATNKTITLAAAPTSYTKIRLYRATSNTTLVDFQNGSRLSEADLDTAYQQGLFVAQEVAEDANTNQFNAIRESSILSGTNLTNFASQLIVSSTSNGLINGTNKVFNITAFTPQTTSPEAFVVSIDGVIQSPTDAYQISMSPAQITFQGTVAPPSGSKIVIVTGVAAANATSVDDSTLEIVTATNKARVKDGGITPAKLSNPNPLNWGDGLLTINKASVNSSSMNNAGIEINQTLGTSESGIAYVDFHSTGATLPDYDARIQHYNGQLEFYNLSGWNNTPNLVLNSAGGVTLRDLTIDNGLPDGGQMRLMSSGYNNLYFDNLNGNLRLINESNANSLLNITSSGVVHIGSNTVPYSTSTDEGVHIHGGTSSEKGLIAASRNGYVVAAFNRLGTDGDVVDFRRDGVQKGAIRIAGNACSLTSSSDYRLKEDIIDIDESVSRVQTLKPVNFAWKNDGTRMNGFIAHELQEVVPEAVHGTKDAVDDKGNPEYQGIDQSKIVPLLTKALQEALTKIESLEARVEALENA